MSIIIVIKVHEQMARMHLLFVVIIIIITTANAEIITTLRYVLYVCNCECCGHQLEH